MKPTLPPYTTTFPYTTLFRSARYADPRDDRQRLREGRYRGGPGAALAGRAEGDSAGGNRRDQGAFELALNLPPPGSRDRKSTRLNSSHLGISYAVFCLKKKIT